MSIGTSMMINIPSDYGVKTIDFLQGWEKNMSGERVLNMYGRAMTERQ